MYQYTQGELKRVQSTLNNAKDYTHLTLQLKALGFQDPQELDYRGGTAQLYSRNVSVNAAPHQYAFYCVLSVGNGYCPVGLKDLCDVLNFLEVIGAQPKESASPDVFWLKAALNRLNSTMAEISNTLEHVLSLQAANGLKMTSLEGHTMGINASQSAQETTFQTQASGSLIEDIPLFDEDDELLPPQTNPVSPVKTMRQPRQ